ncbi:centrosomal protein cep57l1-like isoform X1 [Thalassophryne amazonica]|uniref:centrosomal protein cep57l1-like isoform X1 n=1 Tax=Thalassophryne amazonica TaxID=390379 RepID=UPI001471901A|nr:centrosomal protein cep57l1-like isoform X1 [Thalassophryne amazonica]XP_034025123.1 centrosomal protein cep57l1-like isoform X1 [Thalassophryne amazonica]XP_034025124.1 centrosomal protein cep57l1-like isoform X1 [Thalassophryne amazonica]
MSDSASLNSFVGSFYQLPDRILLVPRKLEVPGHSPRNMNLHTSSTRVFQNKSSIDSQGVVDALKTLQEKIRKLELERKQAEKSCQKFSQDVQKGRHALFEEQASLQSQKCPIFSSTQTQQEKLEKLESDYLQLCTTQSLAEMKIASLEQKLLKEEHNHKLIQEKTDKLQREFDLNVKLSNSAAEEMNPKRQTKRTVKKKLRPKQSASPRRSRCKHVPFVTGTSTSPSHSVHANLQSILHMMKHHQPQLCEGVRELQRAGSGAKKSLQKSFSPDSRLKPPAESLGSLSDLLLALQDELGQMSFDQQELMQQIDAAEQWEHRLDLQRKLESLVARMEEKGAQITKVRKHQQAVKKLTTATRPCPAEHTDEAAAIRPPCPTPVRVKLQGKKVGAAQKSLQLLKETQKFRNCLKEQDFCWET